MTTAIQEYSKTDAALAELASRYKAVVYDVTTTQGMQDAKLARAELRGYRVDLEKTRVEIKSPALERCRLIDAEAKRITAMLADMEDPIDSQIKTEEKRREREAMERVMVEQRRVDGIRARINAIKDGPAKCVGLKVSQIAEVLEMQRNAVVGEDFAEFADEAREALRVSIAQIEVMHAGAVAQVEEAERVKAERAELAKLRAEAEAQVRANREAQEAEQAASRAKIAEEERAAREIRQAEAAKLAADRAKVEAEQRAQEEARREIERRETEVMDARAVLDRFVSRFGHLAQFKAVVNAIRALKPEKAAA